MRVVLEDESAEADFRDARSLFSAGVSHELRTPLARILALVDTVVATALTRTSEPRRIDEMRDEIDGMRQLIEEMVLLVQLESGELAGSGERADVDRCRRRVRRPPRSGGRARIGSTDPARPPAVCVAAMLPRLLDVVLDNLVANAIRHAGAGADGRACARAACPARSSS